MPWPLGRRRSEDEKKRIRQSMTPRVFSADHRANIAAAQLGKKRGPYKKKPKP